MGLLTAKQLKDRECPEFLVDIGDGEQVLCRLPDLQTLIFQRFLPMPLVSEVMTLISQWMGKDMTDISEEALEHSAEMSEFVDRWICAAMVSPRAVMKAEDADENSVVVGELRLETKTAIFKGTFEFVMARRGAVVADATTFPEVGPSEGSGPDSEALQPAPVVAGGN